jgi:(1->4)-alpha-D-glucan 1-alpha-D-glucosylmutase
MRATYRLQLTPAFGFDAARELVPYLAELGVSHIYCSPIMQARPDSEHGYDVVDPTVVSPELGGEDGFRALVQAAREAGLGVIVDFVPNHMATAEENPYWRDPERRQKFFDVDPETGWHRRFFTIDDLAGVRVEDPDVFAETHRKVLQLVDEGLIDGLRIDHPDGLADPATYLQRLTDRGVELIWVEKIIEAGEQLRDWPVQGTTGYEFANDVTALFVDPGAEPAFTESYRALTGEDRSFSEVAAEAKLEQARTAFAPELKKLRALYDHPQLEQATASLHVYRSYVIPGQGVLTAEDRAVLADLPSELKRVLLLEEPGHDEFVTRFQQTTGPVMAKGVEDTAFYRYLRLTALNEVGGDPGRFSLDVETFHRANQTRAARFPRHLLASQTHDTKRSGDVRARIAALSYHAAEWTELISGWRETNLRLRTGDGPDANEELLIYQTLIGTWPIEPERLRDYLEKALREAKVNSNWDEPDLEWERSVQTFAEALYDHRPFLETFEPFLRKVVVEGERAALGALLLRLTSPGVPDIYQGDELWALNLVDPDNRRAVDWPARRRALEQLGAGRPPGPSQPKLAVIRDTLALRRRRPEPFTAGYTPLPADPDVCAFVRGEHVAVVVALGPSADVASAQLPAGEWHERLTDQVALAGLRLLERS